MFYPEIINTKKYIGGYGMNETLELLNNRGSVRSFTKQEVSNDTLKAIINAGCHSATAGNLQPYSIIEIRSSEQKEALMATGVMQPIVRSAPVSLLFVIDWHRIEVWAKDNHAPFTVKDGYRHFWIGFQDTIIAAQNICTAADSLGLGSVYLGTVESCIDELKPMFDLPDGTFPIVIVSLGYPTKQPLVAPKLMYEDIVHKEKYQKIDLEQLNKAMDKKYTRNTPLTAKNIETLYDVTKDVDGEDSAKKAVNYAKDLGKIHTAQRYFGLHYMANWSRTGNKKFLDSLRLYGYSFVDGIEY